MDIQISTLLVTDSPELMPDDTPDTMGPCWSFDVDDEAQFVVVLPDKFVSGSNIVLKLKEATAGESLKHKWSVTPLLEGASSDSFTSEVTSSATADTLTTRLITISTSGAIDDVALAAGKLLSVKIKRIAASATEDSNAIRVYSLALAVTTNDLDISGCGGRVGRIIDSVMTRANDQKGDVTKSVEILDWIIECTAEIAKRGYWKKSATLTLVSGTGSYDLLEKFPEIEQATEIRQVIGGKSRLYALCQTRSEFEDYKRGVQGYSSSSAMADRWAFIEDNTLEIYPLPTGDGGTLQVDYTYCPDDLDCVENTNPRVPKAHDIVYIHYCRAQQADKDHGKPDWQALYTLHMGKFQEALFDLLAQSVPGDISMRPSR